MSKSEIVLARKVHSKILVLRRQKVILDADLAELYGVPVKRLNEQVKRNASRFPLDFLFCLTHTEYDNLRSQFASSSSAHGGRRYLPFAFTEHGAIMAATVLNSRRAIKIAPLCWLIQLEVAICDLKFSWHASTRAVRTLPDTPPHPVASSTRITR